VPAAAIVREEDEVSVYVVGPDQKAHKKKVVLGIANPHEAEVRSGVLVSQKVVVKGQEDLPDGATVTLQTEEKDNAGDKAEPAGGAKAEDKAADKTKPAGKAEGPAKPDSTPR